MKLCALLAGVLTPKEIKNIRNKLEWGTNNNIFSSILGFGSSTIARYESSGSIPSKAHNRILTLLQFPDVVKEFERGEDYEKWLSQINRKRNVIDLADKRKEIFKRQVKNNTFSDNLEKKNNFSLRM